MDLERTSPPSYPAEPINLSGNQIITLMEAQGIGGDWCLHAFMEKDSEKKDSCKKSGKDKKKKRKDGLHKLIDRGGV